jgi:hypothetical protein
MILHHAGRGNWSEFEASLRERCDVTCWGTLYPKINQQLIQSFFGKLSPSKACVPIQASLQRLRYACNNSCWDVIVNMWFDWEPVGRRQKSISQTLVEI